MLEEQLIPSELYHYTSIESLAMILSNRTLRFNSLINVDDTDEAETGDMGSFGKYAYVSCWTDDNKESIPLWKLYTPDMHGVRIALPTFPFKKRSYLAGKYGLKEDVVTFINLEQLYKENKGSITLDFPKLFKVEYTDEDKNIKPQILTVTPPGALERYLFAETMEEAAGIRIDMDLINIGKHKKTDWSFQKEWRYLLFISPMGLQKMQTASFSDHQEMMRRLCNKKMQPPYESYYIDLDDTAVSKMKILFGPKMSEAEKILVKSLLKDHGLSNSWSNSSIHIR